MPEITEFRPAEYRARLAKIVEDANTRLRELAAEAENDLAVLERARPVFEMDCFAPARLWVQEFKVEDHGLEANQGSLLQLCLPDTARGNFPHGLHIKMGEWAQNEQYLATGRYRAVVALIRLDEAP